MYGLYLTLSSWVLFHVATKTEFFRDHLNMFSLNNRPADLREFCIGRLSQENLLLDGPVCDIPRYTKQTPCANSAIRSGLTILDQCMTEQLYVRDSIARTLMYDQVCTLVMNMHLHFASCWMFSVCQTFVPVGLQSQPQLHHSLLNAAAKTYKCTDEARQSRCMPCILSIRGILCDTVVSCLSC